MPIAMGTRLHINLYIYETTCVPILVLLSQNAKSDEKGLTPFCVTSSQRYSISGCLKTQSHFSALSRSMQYLHELLVVFFCRPPNNDAIHVDCHGIEIFQELMHNIVKYLQSIAYSHG